MSATTLILWLYAADVFGSIGIICVVGFALSLSALLVLALVATEIDKPWLAAKRLGWALFAFSFVGTMMPSKSTAYAAAAIYVGSEVAGTEEFGLVRNLVTQELRKLVERKDKK